MAVPLISQDILSFQQIGVDPKFVNISNADLSQDKYLCICEVTDVFIITVDLQNNNNVTKRKMNADAAVMHPSLNIIALRLKSQIQVFDLNQKTCNCQKAKLQTI